MSYFIIICSFTKLWVFCEGYYVIKTDCDSDESESVWLLKYSGYSALKLIRLWSFFWPRIIDLPFPLQSVLMWLNLFFLLIQENFAFQGFGKHPLLYWGTLVVWLRRPLWKDDFPSQSFRYGHHQVRDQ